MSGYQMNVMLYVYIVRLSKPNSKFTMSGVLMPDRKFTMSGVSMLNGYCKFIMSGISMPNG